MTDPAWACPRCGQDTVLAALRIPNGWTTANGKRVRGNTQVLLCTRCDAEDPTTGPIVTYFAVHGTATLQTLDQLTLLLRRWIERAEPPKLDEDALAAETEAWHRGDL
ncbi:DUF6300 family protein [Streptosporangium lutulentum]|uniref:Restriction alleviation protein, Lar family n=1 Tax=Streptosporangium lutulentum TaxID=1461250 RepID=A0ABT9QH87_9ACTN|nr:DUF6300 family protein [Streptosporangium lutulentum]MDP9845736.1 hypothetical protein [Streptosporangium lutulentum]